MNVHALEAVLHALEIGVFERGEDGAFTSIATPPDWMSVFGKSATFPFLGSFLSEAADFWAEPRPSRLMWGPCSERDTSGREFHFTVSALSLPDHRFLVFELDRAAEPMREILQKAREIILAQQRQAGPGSAPSTDATGDDGTPVTP